LSHKTDNTITFHSPRHKCKTGKFKIEIACKYDKEGIEGEVSTQFGFDDVIKVTNLTSETEYHCKGRVLNIEEGSKSNWSESLKITTNFVEEVAILPLEEEKEDEKEGLGLAEDSEVVEPEIMVTDTVVMDIVSEEPVVEDKISEKVVLASNEAAPNVGNEEMKTANIGTIIGIVAGVLIIGIILIVIVGKKKFRTNNYQLEGTHLMDSKTDSVKVEMINCMVEDQPTEIITQTENVNDATKTDPSTANTEDAEKPVGEIVESNDTASNLS